MNRLAIFISLSVRQYADRRQVAQTDKLFTGQRLGQAYVDGLFADGDYRYQKRTLELDLASLVTPEVDAIQDPRPPVLRQEAPAL